MDVPNFALTLMLAEYVGISKDHNAHTNCEETPPTAPRVHREKEHTKGNNSTL